MIVSQLDPRGNIVDRLLSRGVHHSMHSLILERGVKLIPPTHLSQHTPVRTHGRPDTIGLQVVQESLRRVLTSPVGVKDCHTFLNRTT